MQKKRSSLWRSGGTGYSSASVEWATPAEVFAALDAEFGFELDVCATAENAKCRRFYTEKKNGLAQRWTGVCWMNPPYGRVIGGWLAKAADSAERGATVVCLVPARTCTKWWHEQVMARAAEVRLVRGRLKFGGASSAAPFPSAVVVYRPGAGELAFSAWTPPKPARPSTHRTPKRAQRSAPDARRPATAKRRRGGSR